jgi:hypothetical protein
VTIKPALPKEKAPAGRPTPILLEEEEDIGLDDGFPLSSCTRRSRERTRTTEQLPKLSLVAKLTPLMKELEASNEKLRAAYSEQKLDLAELRDDIREFRRGLCAKMRRLFSTTGHAALYDAE